MKTEESPLDKPVRVINIGLERFAEDLRSHDIPVIQMDWRPPAGGDVRLIDLLDRLGE
jgi:FdrA protein